jgi:hypothetical protein
MAMFQKLTRPNIRKLAPGKRLTENGIAFERLANGDGIYTVNIMDGRARARPARNARLSSKRRARRLAKNAWRCPLAAKSR